MAAYFYMKDPFQSKYQLFINRREKVGVKEIKNPKAFIDYSQTIDDFYEHLEDHYATKKVMIISDMILTLFYHNNT